MGNEGLILLNGYALVILIVLSIVFFSKKRLHQVEDNTYGQLLIVSVITILFGLLLGIIIDSDFYLNFLFGNIILFDLCKACIFKLKAELLNKTVLLQPLLFG